MPRINEHTFELDNHEYKLTYYRNDKPILYRNAVLFSGNKSALLLEYIKRNNFPLNLFKGQTTQQLSDLVLKHFSEGNNIVFVDKKSSNQSESTKVNNAKKEKYSQLTNSKDNSTADEEIDLLIKPLNREQLKNKETPKLLIIGCCDAKSQQPNNLANVGHINFNFGNNIDELRKSRIEFYKKLPDNYFDKKKRNKKLADKNYFMNSLNEDNRREALDVYGSNRSPFYNPHMKKLYKDKIKNSNLHLLIISGLYGIIKHDDYINDYHLKIGRGCKKWAGSQIQEVVKKYLVDNNIPNNDVFYSLSDYYLHFLKPIPQWENLWLNHDGHGDKQANDLMAFLDIL